MKNLKNFKILFFSILSIIITIVVVSELHANNKNYKWKQIAGKWKVYNKNNSSYLYNNRLKAYDFGNSELINHNSLISLKKINKLTSLKSEIEIFNPRKKNQFMIFWSAKSYRNFYAFRFLGNSSKINKIEFIKSEVKDTTQPPSKRWNYLITTLKSKKIKLDFSKVYNVEIKLNKNICELFIDNKSILKVKIDKTFAKGSIGFSHEYNLVRIMDIKAYSNSSVIFEDDFSKDSIKRVIVRAKKRKNKK